MNVPFVDLRSQVDEVRARLRGEIDRILESCVFVGGADVAAFELAFAAFSQRRHCVAVANGTDAIELALRAAGVGAGDEVLVPVNTFTATAAAVVRCGASPAFVDVDPVHHLVDVGQLAARLGPRTRAVIPVHLFGQLAPMEDLAGALYPREDVVIVEDAAQCQGATRHGLAAGTWGLAAGTSFYPGKNLGAFGDAGAVVTDSDDVARTTRLLRDHGAATKYDHERIGWNSRMDTLQAVVLLAKLERLAVWNDQRNAAARRYDELLADVPSVRRPTVLAGNRHVWHLYVVRVPSRDTVLRRLQERGIGVGIHYPVPLHLQPAYRHLGVQPGAFPVAEGLAAEMLSLPMFPHITPAQQEAVVTELADVVARHAA